MSSEGGREIDHGSITRCPGFHPEVHRLDACDVLHGGSISDGDLLSHHQHVSTAAGAGEEVCGPAVATPSTARGGDIGGVGGLQWL